ncbi:type 2 lanthipeptide synthetase LanM [Coleofasciculus sp.]|uniref:type 2 lanthipeptide synthetase LanM n=1 Tax=Coleofasciculus sp. TaxID=3100458 RepID=UPI0039F8DF9B
MSLKTDRPLQLSSHQQDRLWQIIARAMPPHERITCEAVVPHAENRVKIDKLRRQWRQAVTDGTPGQFQIYLQMLGLSEEDFDRCLNDVDLHHFTALPHWAKTLVTVLDAAVRNEANLVRSITGGEHPQDERKIPHGRAIEPFLEVAQQFLETYIAREKWAVSPAGLADMVAVIARRLSQLVVPILDFELRLANANAGLFGRQDASEQAVLENTVDSWLDRFERFPVLAHLMAISYAHWQEWMREICDRLSVDWILLRDQMWEDLEPGLLTGFRGDAGDIHGCGRTVAILSFASGSKVVYKPKDLRCVEVFLNVLAFLNQGGLEPPLHVRRVIVRDGYTWEEFVPFQSCQTMQEVERFYRRMGILIRLLQLFEGRDFWLDNLIAHGEQPVFVDLEMLLQPRPDWQLSAEQHIARDILAESALELCVLAMPTPIGVGVGTEDFGALALPGKFVMPYKRVLSSSKPAWKGCPSRNDYTTWTHTDHAPLLNGTPIDAANYLDFLLEGYANAQQCLEAQQEMLQASDGPLAGWTGLWVRFIYRDTWTYHRIVRSSLVPALLADPVQREIFLQQLLRPVIAEDLDGATRDRHAQIVCSEIAALRQLNIPLFGALSDDDRILTLEGSEIIDYFNGTAWERLQNRLKHLKSFPLDREMELIRSGFVTGHRTARKQWNGFKRDSSISPPAERDRWLEEAISISAEILADAVESPTGNLAWLGFVYNPYIDLLSVNILQPDLLTGSCGLAVLFSDLYAATGGEQWKQAALGTLAGIQNATEEAFSTWQRKDATILHSDMPVHCGGYLGLGALIFSLCYCAQILAAPDLTRLALSNWSRLPTEMFVQRASTDVVSGMVGLFLSTISCANRSGDVEGIEIAINLATQLLDLREQSGEFPPPPYAPQGLKRCWGFPNAEVGLALGLSRTIQNSECVVPVRFQRELENAIERIFQLSKPTPGHLLAYLELDVDRAIDPINFYLAIERPATDTVALLDAFEVAATAFEMSGEPMYLERASLFATQIHCTRAEAGYWFPTSLAADRHNLSIFWGLSAIARAFLRMDNSTTVPSIRLLHLPQ